MILPHLPQGLHTSKGNLPAMTNQFVLDAVALEANASAQRPE